MTITPDLTGFEIAIVGLAGRFPGADDLEQFWHNLRQGVESITAFTDDEVRAAGVDEALLRDPAWVKAGAALKDADHFDAGLFGYSPREAAVLDPQQRVLLECAWAALEDAGYNPEAYPGAIGVFAGASLSTYLIFNLANNPDVRAAVDGYALTLANDKDFLTTRISYKLNLRGPSVNIQTACSTSLVAVHLACQSLINYQCDMALAGGVSLRFPQKQGYRYVEGGIVSPDGHCRAFDEQAGGTVGGEGAGLVVLKRLTDALADGDAIRAVIKGTAINNDGAIKVGYTAPSVDGQAEVIAAALNLAGVDAATVQHIEAHGTGTALGDPIEIAALQQVFGPRVPGRNAISISSLKTNIGHLDAAAGVAGLIKTVLSLQRRELPANLHFTRPNPRLNLERTPFFINAELRPWPAPADGGPRRAGVSSFGIGGTNAHAILEAAPEPEPSGPSRPWQLLALSARTPEALEAATARLAAHLRSHPDLDLADAAHTLRVGRKALAERRVVVVRSTTEAAAALEALPATLTHTAPRPAGAARAAFLFTGQGAQYPGMARGLYEAEPIFREHVDECAELLRPHLDAPLLDIIFGEQPKTADAGSDLPPSAFRPALLDQTVYTQPALFAVEYALARLWMSWGVKPEAMLGHSLGEYVAACLAGVFALEDALALVAARGRLMQSLPPGAMLSVPLPESEMRRYLNGHVSVAAVNAPALCVVSGPEAAVAAVQAQLEQAGVQARRLRTSHAFHSAMMDPILDVFAERTASVELRAPRLPFISNVTGTWITDDQATDPGYWSRHLRQAVRFADGAAELLKAPERVCLEVGPGRTLATLVKGQPAAAGRAIVTSLRHPDEAVDDQAHLLLALGRLWAAGVQPDWDRFNAGETRRRVPLPTYPFERERYWVEPSVSPTRRPVEITKRADLGRWAYVPSWKRRDHPAPAGRALSAALEAKKHWLILASVDALSASLSRQLQAAGHDVVTASTGARFDQLAERQYTLNPERAEDFDSLLDELRLLERLPDHVVLDLRQGFGDAASLRGFYSLLYLARAVGRHITTPAQLLALTAGAHSVSGDERLAPAQAAALGLAHVLPQEHPHITCRCVDVGAHLPAARLLAEFFAPPAEHVVAYRGAHRWVQAFEAVELPDAAPLRQGGIYLITGGLGRIGLTLAGHLARAARAKLALVGLNTPVAPERLRALEALGAEVLVITADVADEAQVRAAVAEAEARFGPLNGVLHAAGAVGQAAIKALAETGPAEAEAQFQAKVYGLNHLARALDGKPLDFVMLFSSLSTVLGGLGLGAYAAANAFMDAFAHAQQQRAPEAAPQRWVSVNWEGWDFGETTGPVAQSITALSLTPAEGAQVFERVLALDGPAQVVISTADLDARLAKWLSPAPAQAEAPGAKAVPGGRHARPRVGAAFVAPRDEVEQAVADLWGEMLGLDSIGVDDNFFELGGHSLLATQLASRLRARFAVELPLRQMFNAPTVAGVAALIRAAGQPSAPALALTIPPLPRDGSAPLPLSFGQQRLWFLDQLEPGSPLYNNPAAVRLTGPLDVDALERALNEIVRRHEILRTTYAAEAGQPRQVIAPVVVETRQVTSLHDVTGLPPAARDAEVRRLAAAEAQRPFDLARGPLLRVALLKLAEAEHVVLLTMHHIVSDGWSLGVFTRELAALYDAFSRGAPSPLPPLPIQYADFAAWQRGQLQGAALQEHLAYWRTRLGAGSPPLALPTDRPRPPVQSFRGATRWVRLAPDLSRALYDLGRRHEATVFMTLAAGLIALLHRYTGQDDLSLSTPVAGRHHPETESLIGFFVNTLILRVDAAGDPTFAELLGRVRDAALGAYAHQDLPFEMLVDALQLERDLSRTPLAQVMFVLQNAPASPLETPGLRLAQMETDTGTAKFDLTLMLEESPDGLRGWWNYNTDLFDAATIERLLAHFENLLAAAVADPAARLSALPLLTGAERARFAAWNDTATNEPAPEPVHRLIAAQAARTPDAVALIADAQTLSYRELDERAEQLARSLTACGVGAPAGAETIVGVCVDRSPEAVIALLGIFKAGGAYLPLDPDYPAERLAFMLQDSGAQILLTQEKLKSQLPTTKARVICLDTDRDSILPSTVSGQRSASGDPSSAISDPPCVVNSDSLAYVIYTSGSTGQPKGVMIEHGALAAHCRDVVRHYALTPADRVLQFAALNFDPSLEQVLPTLMAGAAVVLRGDELWPPQDFYRRVVELGLTVVNVPPAYWHQIAQASADPRSPDEVRGGGWGEGSRLRLVIIGGDAMPAESLAPWRRTPLAGARLLNAYGPTEATITATTFEVAPDFVPAFAKLPIGRPLPNRQAFILDSHGRPAPIGVPGELYLAGNLARGYLNRPELTAEKFITRPLPPGEDGGVRQGRLYRTGDLARFLPSGDIEFLGRLDQQVKVRGFRVELGEIESALNQHPAVREAVVAAHDAPGGDKTLAAYVVLADDGRPTTDGGEPAHVGRPPSAVVTELRDFLKARLPAHMVPVAFLALDALPLTPSGKVDRRALPAPNAAALRATRTGYIAPRDPVEALLAQLWAEVLRVERVGAHDNFFDLGGHSLLAVQLAARVRDAFQVDLPLRRLFEATTVADLARLIAQESAAQAPPDELNALLTELDDLSDEDAQRLLAADSPGTTA